MSEIQARRLAKLLTEKQRHDLLRLAQAIRELEGLEPAAGEL